MRRHNAQRVLHVSAFLAVSEAVTTVPIWCQARCLRIRTKRQQAAALQALRAYQRPLHPRQRVRNRLDQRRDRMPSGDRHAVGSERHRSSLGAREVTPAAVRVPPSGGFGLRTPRTVSPLNVVRCTLNVERSAAEDQFAQDRNTFNAQRTTFNSQRSTGPRICQTSGVVHPRRVRVPPLGGTIH